jgi:hypothetical protein
MQRMWLWESEMRITSKWELGKRRRAVPDTGNASLARVVGCSPRRETSRAQLLMPEGKKDVYHMNLGMADEFAKDKKVKPFHDYFHTRCSEIRRVSIAV